MKDIKMKLCKKIPNPFSFIKNSYKKMVLPAIFFMLIPCFIFGAADPDSLLRSRGFTIIPAPQQVELSGKDVVINDSWQVVSEIGDDIAVMELTESVSKSYGLKFTPGASNRIILDVKSGTINETDDPALNEQGYILKISPGKVTITGDSKSGLFYGIQSLLQLFRRESTGELVIPEGTIRDWPDLQLRMIHWDTKNHLDRIPALKEYINRLARLKVNMISYEIWDKFRFPTDPDIGVKEGFTPKQLQDLVDYALERHIQIVPNVQAPAHFQWVLKHERYAHLRADGSDYQACMCDPEVNKLIFSLFQDLIDATKGVAYMHVSTDEVYYAGICDKCERPYNPENRSLAFVDFVNAAHDYLSERGRRIIYWGEWPLMPEHVKLLPSDIIQGVMGASYFVGRMQPITEHGYITEENKHGIRQLVYTAQTASLAPINFSGGGRRQSLENLHSSFTSKAKKGNPIGAFGAGWDDAGPHSELYWLGWTAVAGLSWNSGSPKNIELLVAEFMKDFYGKDVRGMVDIYRDMDRLASFWSRTWDSIVEEVPGTGSTRSSYGNSDGKWPHPRPLKKTVLPTPALPFTDGLNIRPVYENGKFGEFVQNSYEMEQLATSVLYRIEENRIRAERNDHNLRVLETLTRYMRHHARLFQNFNDLENNLQTAESQAALGNAKGAVEALLFADGIAKNIIQSSKTTFDNMKKVFAETRVPGYLTREERYFGQYDTIGMEDYIKNLKKITLDYAKKHNMDIEPIETILNQSPFSGEHTGE
jgi:hexosaminidase